MVLRRYIQYICTLLGFCFFSLMNTQSAFSAPVSVQVLDSIAGYGCDITVEGQEAYQKISFFIFPPLGEKIFLSYSTDSQGKISFSLPDTDTTQAGTYQLVAVPNGLTYQDGPKHSFEIFADDPSVVHSKVQGKNISTSLESSTEITVSLRDKYRNPVEGHRVQLLSSRDGDIIFPLSQKTNTRGEISFRISSKKAGISTFTAFDQTSNTTLRAREDILFYSSRTAKNVGAPYKASLFSTASAQEAEEHLSGDVSSFKINFPKIVEADSDENYITITALDSEERIVKDFTGMVVFQIPTDANAELPGNNGKYIFLKKDQGVFTFPRAVVFPSIGTHRIEVFLYDEKNEEINTNIYGKKSVTVIENNDNPGNSQTEDNPIILYPSDQTILSQSPIIVKGEGKPDSDIKIFLDNIPVQKIPVSSDGKFSTTLEDIDEGKHFLYAMQAEGSQAASDETSFTLQTPPKESISPSPTPIPTPEKILKNITLEGSFTVETQSFDLSWTAEESNEKPILYIIHAGKLGQEMKKIKSISGSTSSFSITSLPIGEAYTFSVTGVKNTGEEGKHSNMITLQSFLPPTPTPVIVTPTPVVTTPTPTAIPVVLPSYTFTAQGGQNNILLTWTPISGAQTYQVQYGVSSGQYAGSKEISGQNNSTKLSDLIPGIEYYIHLQAKDALAIPLHNYGEKVAIPQGAQFHPAPREAPKTYPQWMSQTGPKIFLFIGAIFLAFGGFFLSRRHTR